MSTTSDIRTRSANPSSFFFLAISEAPSFAAGIGSVVKCGLFPDRKQLKSVQTEIATCPQVCGQSTRHAVASTRKLRRTRVQSIGPVTDMTATLYVCDEASGAVVKNVVCRSKYPTLSAMNHFQSIAFVIASLNSATV